MASRGVIATFAARYDVLVISDEVHTPLTHPGLHANVAAFGCADWLDQTISRVVDNDSLLSRMLAEAVRCISAALL